MTIIRVMEDVSVIGKLWEFALYTAGPFIIVLGIMIFVHELGHFVAARAIGVRVLVFKLGFGRFILRVKRGHTEYGVGWMPIGGYVRMFGDPTEVEEREEQSLEDISEEDKKEALYFRPAGQKLLVFFAGPLMNIVLAFMIAPLMYLVGMERTVEPEGPPRVGVVQEGSPAEEAGIQPGDRVLSVGDEELDSFRDLIIAESLNPEQTLVYRVERGGSILEIPVTLEKASKGEPVGQSGVGPPPPLAKVGEVIPGSPAEETGLERGDTIVSVDGNDIKTWPELQEAVNNGEGQALDMVVLRDGEQLKFSITPRYHEDHDRYLIGITYFLDTETVRYGLFGAMVEGSRDCVYYFTLTYKVLWKLVSGQLGLKTLQGPVGIGAITSQAAHAGFTAVIGLMVLITINLGILNLLPFPPLDGGHILFTVLEGVMGREIKMKYKEWVFRAGMVLLLTLMMLVTFNDILRYKSRMGDFVKEIIKGLGLL